MEKEAAANARKKEAVLSMDDLENVRLLRAPRDSSLFGVETCAKVIMKIYICVTQVVNNVSGAGLPQQCLAHGAGCSILLGSMCRAGSGP